MLFSILSAALFLAPKLAHSIRSASTADVGDAVTIADVPIHNYDLLFEEGRASFLASRKGETVAGREHFLLYLKKGFSHEEVMLRLSTSEHYAGYLMSMRVLEFRGTTEELEQELSDTLKGNVRFVVPDAAVAAIPEVRPQDMSAQSSTQRFAGTWGLQRVGAAEAQFTGNGIHVFVLDTGILYSHQGFGGRVVQEFDISTGSPGSRSCQPSPSANCAKDFNGHGTHVAGTVGGRDVGVAEGATLHAMKVLGDSGHGSMSSVIDAFDHLFTRVNRGGFASNTIVATLSLSASVIHTGLETAINEAIENHGVSVVVAAGNDAKDACWHSPAFILNAITVGASDWNDNAASFTNYGPCVDIFAPGVNIESLDYTDGFSLMRLQGTSMACPHVSGAVALLLEENPALTPLQLRSHILDTSTKGAIREGLRTSHNRLLRIGEPAAHTCEDVDGYRDAKGFRCWRWRFNWLRRCTSGGLWNRGYTEAMLTDVKKNCPLSCGMCGFRFGLPPLPLANHYGQQS